MLNLESNNSWQEEDAINTITKHFFAFWNNILFDRFFRLIFILQNNNLLRPIQIQIQQVYRQNNLFRVKFVETRRLVIITV